jgi:carboxymethylenebutenolidase
VDASRRTADREAGRDCNIYWDQASVLVQLGLLEPGHLPVAGVETARKVGDPTLPSNELIRRASVSARR